MKKTHIVILILVIFFVISFLTNILGPIIPDIIDSFNLNLTLVAFLPFAFFIAYAFMSIPAGIGIEKFKEKPVIIASFFIAFIGSISFALNPSYIISIISLFLIGMGMAMLQVALNPLMRVAGGEEHFAFNLVMVQLVFGSASYISPLVYSYLVTHLSQETGENNFLLKSLALVVPANLAWISIYWIFALISLIMLICMYFVRLPQVQLKEDERVGAWNSIRKLLKNKTVWLFFLGIFAYVGSEQGVANWMSKFLAVYHGYDPHVTGAKAVSWFWGLFTAGSLLGMALLKLFDSRKVLIWFSTAAMFCLTLALFGPSHISLIYFPLIGFFASSMWSIIFSLGLNSFYKHHGAFSGILCTGIAGGAVVPLIIGGLGDLLGLRYGLMFLYITLIYIFSIGFWSTPLVTNKTINLSKLTGKLIRKH
ncbi:MAG: MFS transporter [Candidatus Latescibacteria bacterium]|nr:MFS transporter [Candidatus Latescibacterota bacterium]